MKPVLATITALGLAAGVSSAGLVEFTVSGIVTEVLASYGSGDFSDLSVGDTWSFTMFYDVNDNYAYPSKDAFHVWYYYNDPVSFVSANFTAGGESVTLAEHDLLPANVLNGCFVPQYDSDGKVVSFQFEPGPASMFSMLIGTQAPAAPVPGEISLDWSAVGVSAFLPNLLQIESLLPWGVLGPTTADRWATIGLPGGRFAGLITDYSYGPGSGRAVPTPGVVSVLVFAGLSAIRRRRR